MDVREVVTTRKDGPIEVRTRPLRRDPAKALVRVIAAGLGSADADMLAGRFYAQPKFPFVSGYDLVGEVVEAAPTGPVAGTLVAAMPRRGSWTTHAQLDPDHLVPLPPGTDPARAVALVTNGVTAWRMIHKVARVRAGQTVLVHGASGSVGGLLAQLAIGAGATVVGTASAAKLDAVRALGATAVDYRTGDPGSADVIFDHLGGRHLVRSYQRLNPGGTLVSYGSDSTVDATGPSILPYLVIAARLAGWELRRFIGLGRGRRVRLFNVTPDRAFAADLTAVLQSDVDVPVTRYPAAEAAGAMADYLARRVTGKAVLIFD
ncbi:zinc-binding dehydrogenase [Actinokineospora enzanensis]|uniref:zinc-binding dehydrogenase n=1 Tax=Actinokineospora enzanensis TaxID=155975 RepID=UPI0003628FBB|nr:zinc-binding dehydrogenase [Actinokineospora enzanensis]